MRKHLAFLLAAAVPFLILAGMAADQLRVVAKGRPIRVQVVPVDPMSLFQGEYARLGYDFSSMDQTRLKELGAPEELPVKKGDRVWVLLRPGADGLWRTVGLELSGPPSLDGGAVALRAEVALYSSWVGKDWDPKENRERGPPVRHTNLNLRAGLESFFVPQGEADRLEHTTGTGDVTAEISVLPSGRAAVKRLFVKGQELPF